MSDIQSIKDRIDIVQLISEYIQLKKSGINWKACCPFHQEKTPSFMVNQEKQFYHCFGCGKHGDIFSFIQEMEGLDFPDSLKLLADRAGVKIESFRSEVDKSQKNRILAVNEQVADFYHKFLTQLEVAEIARTYLENRGLSDKTINEWQIGYIPDQWDLLTQYLLKKGCGIDDIVNSGLTIQKQNVSSATGRGYYDRFRGRIMFPINDLHGRVVGFTGRILVASENSGGKYINTPQTMVFDKSRIIYGLDKAKLAIKQKDLAVLVEGQLDVISSHQVGLTNVVAASGTALTIEQIKMLSRYSKNIAMAFDADQAGIKAAKRGIDIALEQGLNVKIIQIPAEYGKDADECIQKDKNIWFQAVNKAQGVMDWYFDLYLTKLDLDDIKAKQEAVDNLLAEIIRLPHAVEREHWLRKMESIVNIDIAVLKEEMIVLKNQQLKKPIKDPNKDKEAELKIPFKTADDRYLLDLENLWSVLILRPKLFLTYHNQIEADFFVDTWFLAIYEIAEKQYNDNNEFIVEKLSEQIEEDLREQVNVLILKAQHFYQDLSEADMDREFQSALQRVSTGWQKRQLSKQALKIN